MSDRRWVRVGSSPRPTEGREAERELVAARREDGGGRAEDGVESTVFLILS
jgi:hypothetical protein